MFFETRCTLDNDMAVIPAHFRYSVSTQQAQRLAPTA